jgi:hypothetical protein
MRFKHPYNTCAPDHNIFIDDEYHHNITCNDRNQWVYVEADSSSRPHVYNGDNCSGTDLGGFTNGLTRVPQPEVSTSQGCKFENHGNIRYHPSESSYSSTASTASVPCTDGIEREDPNLAVTTTYLPVVPDTGLNEIVHRRSASIHSDMSYQMRRFLADQRKNQTRRNISPPARDRFLQQDLYIQSAKKKEKKRRTRSYQSFENDESDDQDFLDWEADPTAYAGKWTEDDRSDCQWGNGYSSALSGMTDESSGE